MWNHYQPSLTRHRAVSSFRLFLDDPGSRSGRIFPPFPRRSFLPRKAVPHKYKRADCRAFSLPDSSGNRSSCGEPAAATIPCREARLNPRIPGVPSRSTMDNQPHAPPYPLSPDSVPHMPGRTTNGWGRACKRKIDFATGVLNVQRERCSIARNARARAGTEYSMTLPAQVGQ